jgi:hypothetical protein
MFTTKTPLQCVDSVTKRPLWGRGPFSAIPCLMATRWKVQSVKTSLSKTFLQRDSMTGGRCEIEKEGKFSSGKRTKSSAV